MSIVIVTFRGAPQVNPEAVKKEEELDAKIEEKIKRKYFTSIVLSVLSFDY